LPHLLQHFGAAVMPQAASSFKKKPPSSAMKSHFQQIAAASPSLSYRNGIILGPVPRIQQSKHSTPQNGHSAHAKNQRQW
tara:strand:+ start:287 stop:526 length:240 start_codon:yes stop_codon:yes gene_type:complete